MSLAYSYEDSDSTSSIWASDMSAFFQEDMLDILPEAKHLNSSLDLGILDSILQPPSFLGAHNRVAGVAGVAGVAAWCSHLSRHSHSKSKVHLNATFGAVRTMLQLLGKPGAISRENELISRIRSLGELQPDWDGYGGRAPSSRCVLEAESFCVLHIATQLVLSPEITAASDGEINFHWVTERGLVDLGFYGDGVYSFFAKESSGEEHFGDEWRISQGLAPSVQKIIELDF